MRKSRCLNCNRKFRSKKDKEKHKKEFPNNSCVEEVKGGNNEMKTENKVERKSPIQKVQKIVVPIEQAKIEWKKYCELLKKRKDKHLKIMKDSMYWAKQGKALINVYEVMKKAGINSKNQPRFAIARADINVVRFEKQDTGSGEFLMEEGWNRSGWSTDVHLPQKTFNVQWERDLREDGTQGWSIKDKHFSTKVPIIPAELMPEGDLKNYYILWEVKSWEVLPFFIPPSLFN